MDIPDPEAASPARLSAATDDLARQLHAAGRETARRTAESELPVEQARALEQQTMAAVRSYDEGQARISGTLRTAETRRRSAVQKFSVLKAPAADASKQAQAAGGAAAATSKQAEAIEGAAGPLRTEPVKVAGNPSTDLLTWAGWLHGKPAEDADSAPDPTSLQEWALRHARPDETDDAGPQADPPDGAAPAGEPGTSDRWSEAAPSPPAEADASDRAAETWDDFFGP